ncbi:MAG: hypothetical protein HOP33_18770 [Verrucomicrobia bacterium]|nr:hypothetical protein [Verrucomicrobiota bacterium]
MVFKFEDGWDFTLVMVLGPIGMVIYIFFPHFLKIWRESKTKGAALAIRIGLRKIASFGFWVILISSVFWAFKVRMNRDFVGLTIKDQLVLDYPWPKSDAVLPWPAVLKVESESRVFGAWERTMFHLRVETKDHVYTSLWMKSEPVVEVRKAVEAHLQKRKLSN